MNLSTIFLEAKKHEKIIALILVYIVIIAPSFYRMFETNSEILRDYNSLFSDLEPIIKWIRDNTTSSDRFLATSNSRMLAWFTDRQVFKFTLFNNSAEIPLQDINGSVLTELITNFNITYLIADSIISKNPELSYLFDLSDIKIIPVFFYNNGQIGDIKFMLEKVVISPTGKAILYKVIKNGSAKFTITRLNELDATFEATGNITIRDGKIDIITGPVKGVTYLTCKFGSEIETNNTLLIVDVENSTSSVGGALMLKFSNSEFFISYISPGIFIYKLDSIGGNGTLCSITLYASLRNGEGYFTIRYNGIWLIKTQNH
jgi:hypothetical protein